MHWSFDELAATAWERLLAGAERCALQQSWAYGVAAAGAGAELRRAVLHEGRQPRALAQLVLRRLPGGLRFGLLLRGPAWLGGIPDPVSMAMALARLREGVAATAMLWQPDDAQADASRGGWRRVWTGPSTVWLDLTLPPASLRTRLDGKWRNMLTRAEAAPLTVVEAKGGAALDWLLAANERQRRAVGYRAPPASFIRALVAARPGTATALVAHHQGTPAAGILVVRHGRAATYYAGVTSPVGRQWRAHHRLLWAAILQLQRAGCTTLDLGGVDTVNSPGIARFKLGLGGEPITLAGSYLLPPRLCRTWSRP